MSTSKTLGGEHLNSDANLVRKTPEERNRVLTTLLIHLAEAMIHEII
jgi:hypothetical protein